MLGAAGAAGAAGGEAAYVAAGRQPSAEVDFPEWLQEKRKTQEWI